MKVHERTKWLAAWVSAVVGIAGFGGIVSPGCRDGHSRGEGEQDGDGHPPEILSIEGTGESAPIAPRLEDREAFDNADDKILAERRIDSETREVVIGGTGLLGAQTVRAVGGDGQGTIELEIMPGGTDTMLRVRFPSASAVTAGGLFLLTLFTPSGQAQADVFFLQGQDGQDGQDGQCDCNVSSIDGDLTVTGNISVGGNADVAGDTSLGGSAQVGQDLEVAGRLSVTGSYELPDCPSGYEVDPSADPSILVCVDPVNGDEMVHVGDFWIDRYEVTVFDAPTCAGAPLGDVEGDWPAGFPENGNWETKLYACSVPGGNPSRFLTWYSAQQACAAMGKQLCTNSEWQAAAAGTHDPGDHDGTWGGACHTAGLAARQTGNAGNAPGETGSCISVWGMEDAIGNVWEWVADWHAHPGFNGETNTRVFQYAEDGYWAGGPIYSAMPSRGVSGSWRGTSPAFDADGVTLGYFYGPAAARRGGSWGSSTRAGVFALAVSSGPSHTYEYQGARCCRRR